MAPRLRATIDQKKLEDRLAPLMQRVQGPGELPESGAVLASPVSWAAPGRAAFPSTNEARRGAQLPVDSLLRQRDYAAAEKALTEQLAQNPNDPLAYRFRAITRRLEKDYQGALDDATKAIALDPKDRWARNIRALALVDLERYPEAVDEAGRSLRLDPKDAGAFAARAAAWRGLGRKSDRLDDLKEASTLDPQFGDLYRRALAEEQDAAQAPAPQRNADWLAYASGTAGLLLFLAGAALLLWKSGRATTRTRPPMRLADRLAAAGAPTLEGFEIIRKVGEGGMGVVYEAVDRALRRKVALKQLRDAIAGDPRERKRFLREASTVASLKHPNIVQIHSAFEAEGGLYLVFEFVAGEPLARILSSRGALAPAETLSLLEPIAKALDYAHDKGVIHQDLKPGNIMVEGGAAKVMDFGISRRLTETSPWGTTTRNEIAGTPPYMAPEQESGQPAKESDLFALGVCAYELLSGKLPFEGKHALAQKLEGRFTPLSQAAPAFPAAADRVIAKILHPRTDGRHASARQFLDDLAGALSA